MQSYMNNLYNRPRPAAQHRAYQQFWPEYVLPPIAKLTQPAQGAPPAYIPGTNMPAQERSKMSYGSYYESDPNYWRNPVPYTSSDIGEPVPGWGTSVQVAGPRMLGVGAFGQRGTATAAPTGRRILTTLPGYEPGDATGKDTDEEVDLPPPGIGTVSGLPWWIWPVAAAVAMGGVGYYGTKKGWF